MYEKQNFYAGQKLMASHLDAMEDAIIEALNKETVSSWNDLTDKPFGEEVVDGETVIKQIDPKYIPEDAMGVGSWDDLTNKPFYECEKEVTETMTIEWDGVVGDRAMYAHESGYFTVVHISDVTLPNADAAIGAVITINENGTETEETVNEAGVEIGSGAFMIGNNVLSVPSDNFECDLGTLPKKGLYSIWFDGTLYVSKYVGALAHTVTELKQLDAKYLPFGKEVDDIRVEVVSANMNKEYETIVNLTWNATDYMFAHVSDYIIPSDEVISSSSFTSRNNYGNSTSSTGISSSNVFKYATDNGDAFIITSFNTPYVVSIPYDNCAVESDYGTYLFQKKGLYFLKYESYSDASAEYISWYAGPLKTTINTTIDANWLPANTWDSTCDKPFYDDVITSLEWDGEIGDREVVDTMEDGTPAAGNDCYVLITENIIPKNTIYYTHVHRNNNGNISEYYTKGSSYIAVIKTLNKNGDMPNQNGVWYNFTKPGVYFRLMKEGSTYAGTYPKKIELSTPYIVESHPLDARFIPEIPVAWSEVKDKPFYDEMVTDIEFDGNLDGKTFIELSPGSGFGMVHVSDFAFDTAESTIGTEISLLQQDGTTTNIVITAENLSSLVMEGAPGLIVVSELACVSIQDNMVGVDLGGGLLFPKKGMYVLSVGDAYVSKVSLPVPFRVFKQIPDISWDKIEDAPCGEYTKTESATETIEWDCVAGDRAVATGATMADMPADYVLLSDGVIATAEDALAMTGTVYTAGETGSLEEVLNEDLVSVDANHASVLYGYIISVFEDNSTITLTPPNAYAPTGTVTFPKRGTYSIAVTNEGAPFIYVSKLVANLSRDVYELKKLDNKFLPEVVEPKELILASSTEGSTKKFKITVDDSGTITATEVV